MSSCQTPSENNSPCSIHPTPQSNVCGLGRKRVLESALLPFMNKKNRHAERDPLFLSFVDDYFLNRHVTGVKRKDAIRAVNAGYQIVRHDAIEFITNEVYCWQLQNPWSEVPVNPYSGNDSITQQFLTKMHWVEVKTNPKANIIQRRISLMRLFYYYHQLVDKCRADKINGSSEFHGRGKDNRTCHQG
jgi:hypothetical protein